MANLAWRPGSYDEELRPATSSSSSMRIKSSEFTGLNISAGLASTLSGKANIIVSARFRPVNPREMEGGGREGVELHADGRALTVLDDRDSGVAPVFTFDRVFGPSATQEEVYRYAASPLVEDVFNGFYSTVFAYGQTGSGKTHTMEGEQRDDSLKGVIPRAIEHVFDKIAGLTSENLEYTVLVSYCEIYCEKIRDLLDTRPARPGAPVGSKPGLEVRVDVNRGVYIDGASEHVARTDADVLQLLEAGSRARHVGGTAMNEESSRSHAIFQLTVNGRDSRELTVKTGKLFLVDLAGSEMVSKTGARDQRLEEAKMINKSLSALGNVIKALTDSRATHIPYRDSKLTRILQDSLGGSSRTSLIIACSPAACNLAETVSTLRFGHRAKAIRNKPRVHTAYAGTSMDDVLRHREEEIASLLTQLEAAQATNAAYAAAYGPPPVAGAAAVKAPAGSLAAQAVKKAGPPIATTAADLAVERERAARLQGQVASLEREAATSGRALSDLRLVMADMRALLAHLRSGLAGLLRAATATAGGEGGGAIARIDGAGAKATGAEPPSRAELDKFLSMGCWMASRALK